MAGSDLASLALTDWPDMTVALAQRAMALSPAGWAGLSEFFPMCLQGRTLIDVRHGLVMYEYSQILHMSIFYQKEQNYHLT